VKTFEENIIARLRLLEREVERLRVGDKAVTITDHGALTGLADDDHTQYLNNTRHDTTTRHTLGTVVPHDDHGALSGLSDNDHPQYLLTTGKAADSDKLDGKTYAQLMLSIYPVGSIYMSVNSTNPGTLFGGTWAAWGAGRVPVGINTSDADFNTVEETGGAKTHSHGLSAGFAKLALSTDNWLAIARKSVTTWTKTHKMTGTVTVETTTSAVGTELGGDTDSSSSLQPYIVCYMWKRTA